MAFTRVRCVFLLILLAWSAAERSDQPTSEQTDDSTVEQMEASSVVFFPNDEKNDTTPKSGWNETALPTSTVRQRPIHFPVRIGPWMIVGCHNNENSWGCEMGRMVRIAASGFIDTLKFVMLKDKSLKVVNSKERCTGCGGHGGKSHFRVMVSWPKCEDSMERNEKFIRRVKVVYFQAGFLCALGVIMACAVVFLCCVKATNRPEKKLTVKLISQRTTEPTKM